MDLIHGSTDRKEATTTGVASEPAGALDLEQLILNDHNKVCAVASRQWSSDAAWKKSLMTRAGFCARIGSLQVRHLFAEYKKANTQEVKQQLVGANASVTQTQAAPITVTRASIASIAPSALLASSAALDAGLPLLGYKLQHRQRGILMRSGLLMCCLHCLCAPPHRCTMSSESCQCTAPRRRR